MRRIIRFAAPFCVFVCSLYGQFQTAEVLGTVHDASDATVANVAVALTNEQTAVEKKTSSDGSGNYDFFDVPVGRYTVTAEARGFSKSVTQSIIVDVNARQRVDITMQVGAISESVNVTSSNDALQTDSSEHSQVINTRQIVSCR